MILIIGGMAQGKLAYAKSCVGDNAKIIDESYTRIEDFYTADIINHFHEIIKKLMRIQINDNSFNTNIDEGYKQTNTLEEFCVDLVERNPNVCIITNEIGYGIVPIDALEREYRERTGRICCELAKRADKVFRIVCGIPNRIK